MCSSYKITSTLLIFKKKSEIFNPVFAEQCSLVPNKKVLRSQLTLLTENSLANCHFSKKGILQIIRNLDSNKVHGHDMINILMINLCGDLIGKLLELIFKTCLRNGRFLNPMLSLFISKVINKPSKTIVQFHFYLFVEKYLNACFMTLQLICFSKNNLLSPNNLDQEILASINVF